MSTIVTIFLTIIGFITSQIAKKNNRNQYLWFFLGYLFGFIGLISLLIMNKYYPKKKIKRKRIPKASKTSVKLIKKPHPSLKRHENVFWYYLDKTDEQFGPLSFDAITKYFKENKISKNTYVWNENYKDWREIHKISGFKEIFYL